ncbi:MFS transporter [Streptomyces sp. 7R007]
MSSTSAGRPSYAAVLRLPHARRTFAAALLGRLSYGVVPLSAMLAVTRSTGSYAVAGTVAALFGGTSVFLTPARASLIDRYGPRRALAPMAAAHTVLLALLTALAWRPGAASPLALDAVAALAGACTPPLGPTMRAVWSRLAPDRALLQRAYGLDGVAEELLFVTGPLLVGTLVGVAPPAAGIAFGACLMAAGTAGFVGSPAVRATGPAERDVQQRVNRPKQPSGVLRRTVQPVVAVTGVGLAVGAVELVVVAFAGQRHYGDDAAAWTLAALSAGSALGGLLHGAVAWRPAARVRLPFAVAGLGLALLGAGLADGLGTLAVALAAAGFFVAPALTTAYLAADEAVAAGARVRAGAWVNTGVNAGMTAGAAGAGVLVGGLPTALCFAVAGALALLTASATVRGALRHPVPDRAGEAPAPSAP